jgi:hypothetical protein
MAAAIALAAIALGTTSASAQSGAPPVAGAEQASQGTTSRNGAAGGGGKPEVVKVGALINDIQQLDLQTHSYAVDIYLWFKWRNPDIDPSRTFEFLNPFELWGHIR